MKFKNILFVFGTRPEAIKLAPLWHAFKKKAKSDNIIVCSTGQHDQMLRQILEFFDMRPNYDLNLMEPDQTLFKFTSKAIREIEDILKKSNPEIIFVQGDTTSAFIGALAGYYQKIKVAHIEAGLRTHSKYSPFPEEINRVLVDHLSDYHFAPTEIARKNLSRESITKNVWVVGNTVIDALFLSLRRIKEKKSFEEEIVNEFRNKIKNFNDLEKKKIIFVTAHRRESFGLPFYNICKALNQIAREFPDVQIIYPVHLNPNVRKPVFNFLEGARNIHLLDPLNYPQTIWLMQKSYFILTDSGGIQEEAPSLGKPVLVMREVTERMEGIEAGTAKLVGSDNEKIFCEASLLLNNKKAYEKMSKAANPYGDGRSSNQIVEIIESLESN